MLRTAMSRIFVLVIGIAALLGCTVAQDDGVANLDAAQDNEVAVIEDAVTMVAPLPTAEVVLIEPTSTSEPEEPFVSRLPILQPAPNITNETWINTEPLTLEGLRGKVVLIEFWTYG